MHNTHCPTQERCASGRSHIPVRPKNHTHVRVAAQTLKGSMPRNRKRRYEQQRNKQQSKLVWRCLRSICAITTIPFWAFFKHLEQVQVWGGRWISSFFGATAPAKKGACKECSLYRTVPCLFILHRSSQGNAGACCMICSGRWSPLLKMFQRWAFGRCPRTCLVRCL